MLAQLKTVVLIKEAIKLAFFKLVEYLGHQHLGLITCSKWQKNVSSEEATPGCWPRQSCKEKARTGQ
jgi:hypothetical protein